MGCRQMRDTVEDERTYRRGHRIVLKVALQHRAIWSFAALGPALRNAFVHALAKAPRRLSSAVRRARALARRRLRFVDQRRLPVEQRRDQEHCRDDGQHARHPVLPIIAATPWPDCAAMHFCQCTRRNDRGPPSLIFELCRPRMPPSTTPTPILSKDNAAWPSPQRQPRALAIT